MHCSTPQTTMPRWLCGVLCEYAGISSLFNTPHNHAQVAVCGMLAVPIASLRNVHIVLTSLGSRHRTSGAERVCNNRRTELGPTGLCQATGHWCHGGCHRRIVRLQHRLRHQSSQRPRAQDIHRNGRLGKGRFHVSVTMLLPYDHTFKAMEAHCILYSIIN